MKFRALLAFMVLTSCSGASFKGITKDKFDKKKDETPQNNADSIRADSVTYKNDRFFFGKSSSKVDMIWVIDNSGSMGEEVSQVRENFSLFHNSLTDDLDIKIALVSLAETTSRYTYSIKLPSSSASSMQVNEKVDSYNALLLAAASTCPAPESTDYLCGMKLPDVRGKATMIGKIGPEVHGKLEGFLRPHSTRVYIIVTDDNARLIDSTNFLQMVSPNSSNKVILYAFAGVPGESTCGIVKAGVDYEKLAKNTGGKILDICKSDWSSHFDELTESITRTARSVFELSSSSDSPTIASVTLNGKPLTENDYLLTGKLIAISSPLSEGAVVDISYSE